MWMPGEGLVRGEGEGEVVEGEEGGGRTVFGVVEGHLFCHADYGVLCCGISVAFVDTREAVQARRSPYMGRNR